MVERCISTGWIEPPHYADDLQRDIASLIAEHRVTMCGIWRRAAADAEATWPQALSTSGEAGESP